MRAFFAFVIGAMILFIAGLISSIIHEKSLFLLWLFDWRHPAADYFFYYVTMLGESYSFIFFGLLLWISSWRRMITVPALGLIVMGISFLLKQYFRHERPGVYLSKIQWEGSMSVLGYPAFMGFHSFPSGHSMAAWAIFTLMAAHIKKTWFSMLCLFLALAVSISRVYLMAHFLQDVVAGAMIGFSLGYGVYYSYAWWMKKNAYQL